MNDLIKSYYSKIESCFNSHSMNNIEHLAKRMKIAWENGSTIYFCGNGGSAGNATHLANDFLYGAGILNGIGLRVESLSANASILTCLGNDIGYENIFSEQLRVKGNKGDVLVILSGSGNSSNILNALELANKMGIDTFAILGFNGGKALKIANTTIHFEINDMQVSEDMQMIVGHLCMQWLSKLKINK
jgi:D-sedoheptulose 7-phosphate isomerase